MARNKKVEEPIVVPEETVEEVESASDKLHALLEQLLERVESLEKQLAKPKGQSIQKVEPYTNEVASTIESYNGMKMEAEDKIQSMRNAIKILPPNMVDANGRQLKENIEAIVGFKCTDEMVEMAYEGIN